MLDQLRDRMTTYLATHRVCIISTQGTGGASAVLARYHLAPDTVGRDALQIICLVPRWAEATYHLEQDSRLLLIIPDPQRNGLRWLQVRGSAQSTPATDWTTWLSERSSNTELEHRYLAIRVTPQRIDLVDEDQGWGISETLDL